jgi:hypothetical protein
MGKNIKSFEYFVNEEISDTYLNKQIDKAGQEGRKVSPEYRQNLKSKNDQLRYADDQRKEKAAGEEREKKNRKIQNVVDILNGKLDNRVWNISNYGELFVKANAYNGMISFGFINKDGVAVIIANCNIERDNIEVYDIEKDTQRKTIISIQRIEPFFIELQKMFREYFPESRYADRKIWSSL